MKIKWNEKYTTISAYVIIVFAICYGIYKITDNLKVDPATYTTIMSALVPFFIALLLSYFLYPFVDLLESSVLKNMKAGRLKRFLSIFICYLFIFGMSILLLSFIVPQILQSLRDITRLVQRLNNYVPEIENILNSQRLPIFNTDFYIDLTLFNSYLVENVNLKETLNSLSDLLSGFVPSLISFLSSFASGFLNVILGMIVAIYILASKEKLAIGSRKMIRSLFSKKGADSLLVIMADSHSIFNGFIIGSLIDAAIIGLLTFLAMVILRLDYALLISLIVAITNIIPYFGPLIGGAVGVVLLIFVSPIKALTFGVLILVVQQFDGNFLKPKIFGQSVGLGPISVIFSIFLFGKLFGFIGMFLGVPIFTIFKNIFDRYLDKQFSKKYPDDPEANPVEHSSNLPYDIHNKH